MREQDRFLAWCQSEQASLRRQLELLESGDMRTGERDRDTTAETLEEVRRKLAELDALLHDVARAGIAAE